MECRGSADERGVLPAVRERKTKLSNVFCSSIYRVLRGMSSHALDDVDRMPFIIVL